MEAGRLGGHGHPWLFSEFKTILDYMKPLEKQIRAGDVAQLVECLSSLLEALSLIPSTM